MLIRSQDRKNLIELQNINLSIGQYATYPFDHISFNYNIETLGCSLGTYSSEEKAIKVLDLIEEEYQTPTYINDEGGGEYANYWQKVFHMPEDSEV